jgi:hypothetical protein
MEPAAMTAPWLQADAIAIALAIQASHRRLVGGDLVPPEEDPTTLAVALHEAPRVVLAHDGGEDPRFIYANRRARELWGYAWPEFIGMPSRLSAPPEERSVRSALLARGRADGVAVARDLVRATRAGRRFAIAEVVLWNLDVAGRPGQAATYDDWRFIDPG